MPTVEILYYIDTNDQQSRNAFYSKQNLVNKRYNQTYSDWGGKVEIHSQTDPSLYHLSGLKNLKVGKCSLRFLQVPFHNPL